MSLPPHFQPERVGEVWRVHYQERARDAETAAERARHPPGCRRPRPRLPRRRRHPEHVLHARVRALRPRSGRGQPTPLRVRLPQPGTITEIVPTLDTHQAIQIFHSAFLVDADGNRPGPYSPRLGRGRGDRAVEDRSRRRGFDPDYLLRYTGSSRRGGRYRLTVWPYHAMLGGIGHALVSAVEEAFFFHAIARRAAPASRSRASIR